MSAWLSGRSRHLLTLSPTDYHCRSQSRHRGSYSELLIVMSNSQTLALNFTCDRCSSSPEDLLILSDRPFIPHLRSKFPPQSLAEYHEIEGRDNRKRRLRRIWQSLPNVLKQSPIPHDTSVENGDGYYIAFEQEKMQLFKIMYDRELLLLCKIPAAGSREPCIGWKEFKMYAEVKEAGSSSSAKQEACSLTLQIYYPELWYIFHDKLDLDGNGHLDCKKLYSALSKAGMGLSIFQNPFSSVNPDHRHGALAIDSI